MNTSTTRLVCHHDRAALGSCLDCGAPVPVACAYCGASLTNSVSGFPPSFCAACGLPTPWFLEAQELDRPPWNEA